MSLPISAALDSHLIQLDLTCRTVPRPASGPPVPRLPLCVRHSLRMLLPWRMLKPALLLTWMPAMLVVTRGLNHQTLVVPTTHLWLRLLLLQSVLVLTCRGVLDMLDFKSQLWRVQQLRMTLMKWIRRRDHQKQRTFSN